VSRLYVQFTVREFTFDIGKVRVRLGYEPRVEHDRWLREAVEWESENHGEGYVRSRLRTM
jgi:nucleoside-diphosphate-sugar epimerase